jgi:hypothetical protein
VPAFKRAEEAIKADPTKSNRAIAGEIGVDPETVRRARNKSGAACAAADDRPTIDTPPKGNLWDECSLCRLLLFELGPVHRIPEILLLCLALLLFELFAKIVDSE